ncbi:MAG: helix-turn-helix transcriptional regulator [Lachnospiraceae bacterium]|nr:helix-turn-helix transcriptional regulator [Lachnospiraceae bacterium]MBR1852013.1 helix-turn-helix transcriptional regulator [Lachnospiraceae bacterium]
MIKGLGERLQQSRINSKLSRKQVAELLGVSTSIVGLYETDVRQPSLSALMKLASIYKVTTDYLLGCEPIEKKSLSLNGLSDKQIEALTLTYKCFQNQSL